MYYRPDDGVAADVIPFFHDGEFKLFYLRDYRDRERNGEGVPWCLVTTKDFVQYREYGEVLPRGAADEQDLFVFTGSVLEHDGRFYIFYTGHNHHFAEQGKNMEELCLAVSDDLVRWEKDPSFRIAAPEGFEPEDFRDPFVFFNGEAGQFWMLVAARRSTGGSPRRRGVTLLYTSDDLRSWKLTDAPLYAPDCFYMHECPDLFQMGDYWYLLFSEFSDKSCTRYRYSRSPSGSWTTPLNDTFDNRCLYAAKTAADDKGNRFLFGWNPIRNNDKDGESWQWGGTVVVHQLVQNDDGTLYVRCPDSVRAQYKNEQRFPVLSSAGSVKITEESCLLKSEDGYAAVNFGETGAANFKIEADIEVFGQTGDFGFSFIDNPERDTGYFVKFEPRFNRLCFNHYIGFGDRQFLVESERYCPMTPERHRVLIVCEGSVIEVYVDDAVAMSARMYGYKACRFGIYAQDCRILFENLRLYF